jgi:hypothetical protein
MTSTLSNTFNESLSDEDQSEEEALSAHHGEAQEARGEKRKTEADDVEQLYDEKLKKKPRIPRPKLTAENLTGVNGLIRLPMEFKAIHYRGEKKDVKAAAAYSRSLMKAYTSFCSDLFPSAAFEDVLTTIEEKLGGKKEVKTYVQHLRDDVRNRHVEKLYGKEKAEKMLLELEDGLRQQEEEMDPFPQAPTIEAERTGSSSSAVSPDSAPRNNTTDQEEELEATFEDDEDQPAPIVVPATEATRPRVSISNPYSKAQRTQKKTADQAEEKEATFDTSIDADDEEEATTQVPTQLSQEVPTQVPTQLSQEVPTQVSTQLEVPTQVPTQLSQEVPTQVPIQLSQEVPTQVPTQLSQEVPTQVPTQLEVPTQVPTQLSQEAPTQVPTQLATQEALDEEGTIVPTMTDGSQDDLFLGDSDTTVLK